jgi:hypothetical protein
MSIAIIPGSFKPPHRGHWEMILEYAKNVDKVIILISNISTAANLSLKLNSLNKNRAYKIIHYFNRLNLNNEAVNEIMQEISNNLDEMTNNDLINKLNEILNIKDDNTVFLDFCEFIKINLNFIKNNSLKTIRKTSNETEITPEMSKEIFEIFIKSYNLEDKVSVEISSKPSPISSMFDIIQTCQNCKIYLGVSSKGNDATRFNRDFSNDLNNEIIVEPMPVKTMISATTIRNNINDLQESWFPEKLSNNDFKKIKEILN